MHHQHKSPECPSLEYVRMATHRPRSCVRREHELTDVPQHAPHPGLALHVTSGNRVRPHSSYVSGQTPHKKQWRVKSAHPRLRLPLDTMHTNAGDLQLQVRFTRCVSSSPSPGGVGWVGVRSFEKVGDARHLFNDQSASNFATSASVIFTLKYLRIRRERIVLPAYSPNAGSPFIVNKFAVYAGTATSAATNLAAAELYVIQK